MNRIEEGYGMKDGITDELTWRGAYYPISVVKAWNLSDCFRKNEQ